MSVARHLRTDSHWVSKELGSVSVEVMKNSRGIGTIY